MAVEKNITNILLIGASGFVGRMVAKAWSIAPSDDLNITLQRRHPNSAKPKQTTDFKVIAWNPDEGAGALIKCGIKPDVMLVLAGVTPASGAPLKENVAIAQNCLLAAREIGCQRVLLASSSSVYGVGSNLPFTEDMPLHPVNPYGVAKQEMEQSIEMFQTPELEVCCLRIGNVLGADALLLNAMSVKQDRAVRIDLFASGSGPVRSYIDPITLAQVLRTLATTSQALPSALNISAPDPVSMDALAIAAGFPWNWQDAPDTAHERIVLDVGRLKKFHHFLPDSSTPSFMIAQLKKVSSEFHDI